MEEPEETGKKFRGFMRLIDEKNLFIICLRKGLIMRIVSGIRQYYRKRRHRKQFAADCSRYSSMNNDISFQINPDNVMPAYEEEAQAGSLDEHYFLQDIWMARQIRLRGVREHYDVGSRIDGFIAHLLSMDIEVTLIDIRCLDIQMNNLKFQQGDATDLSGFADNSVLSLSSLHAIEHFGLGRYGDEIDPYAWKKVLHSFERVLAKNGILYISVPVGERNHVVFNAHRVFAPQSIIAEVSGMELVKFAYIENYKVHEIEDFDLIDSQMAGKDYLCGCFVFRKKWY